MRSSLWKKWKYNTQLSNSLNWKPAGTIDLLKSWKFHVITRCWNAENSSGKDLLLGRWRIVCCVNNKDVYLKVFWFIDHCSVQFSPRRKYYFSKYNSHSIECFVANESFLLTKRIHCLFSSALFKGNEILHLVP